MTKIEMNRVYRTRDGREVRIYAVDGYGGAIHGAVYYDGWLAREWTAHGCYNSNRLAHDMDLIEVKPRIQREVWVNVYPTDVTIHREKQAADYMNWASTRIACVKLVIDVEEGHGLD